MRRLDEFATRAIEVVVTVLLAAMVVMVFGNVVLRYVFNSGLHVSDELSRFAFIWLTFLGAVLTFRDNAHVNIETLLVRLSPLGRRICMALTQIVVVICSAALFLGTLAIRPYNVTMKAPVTGVPMNWISDVGLVAAAGFALIALIRLGRIVSGHMSDAEIDGLAGMGNMDGQP